MSAKTASQHGLANFAPQRERHGLALCLSGGGFRAALFHLGALRRLNELGILSAVDTISAVSGGSILAAHLAAVLRPWPPAGTVVGEWDTQVVESFRRIAARNIRTPAVLRRLLPWKWFSSSAGVRALAAIYRRVVTGMDLVDLPERPRFVFCSTDMEFGVNWEFRRDRSGDYQVGYAATPPDWPVARAVAASSAFPPVFNPLPAGLPAEAFVGGRRRPTDLRLTDGGVYDNLGLEPVWKTHDTLLVSDGGAPFAFEPDRGLLRRLRRYADIIGGQVAALRKRWLVSNFIADVLDGTYWGIGSAVESYDIPGSPGYTEALVAARIATIRTDLDAFSPAEMDVLENHGYTLAAAAIVRHTPELARITPPPPSAPPHRHWMNEKAVDTALAQSKARRLLGRWRETRPAALACAVLLASAPAPLAGQSDSLVVRETARPCARVRQRAAPDARVKACLPPGTRVVGIGVVPFWRKVRMADRRTGWVAKQSVENVGAARPLRVSGAATSPETSAASDNWLEVHVVDVGQGDAIWIHTPDDGVPGNGIYEGKSIIIDGGPDASDGRNQLLRYLRRSAPEGAIIDALIVTHPHNDHYPGARGILRHYQVREYFDPGYPSERQQYLAFLRAVEAESAGGRPIVRHIGRTQLGQPDWGSELRAQFLYAFDSSLALGSGSTRENNSSIVLRVAYGTQSFLFMGDAEGKERDASPDSARYVERWLLDSVGASGLKSTVLKVAHHGSETSSTLPFIRAVSPRVLIVASGRRPYRTRFLPDSSTLRRYCDHSAAIRIYRTDQDDAAENRTGATDADGDHIVIRTNGTVLLVDAYSAGARLAPTACEVN